MHADADLQAGIRRRLERAIGRRRLPWRLAPLVPPLAVLHEHPAGGFAVLAAAVGWAAWDAYTWRRRIAASWPRWLDEAVPVLEDSSALLAQEPSSAIARLQRARLERRVEAVDALQYRAIAHQRSGFAPWPFALSCVAAAALWLVQPAATQPVAVASAVAAKPAVQAMLMKIAPPAYTGAKPYDTAPKDLQVPQYSTVSWCGTGSVELGDGSTPQAQDGCAAWRAGDSTTWRLAGKPQQRYTIRVTPDQPPVVSVTAPVEAVQVLSPGASVKIAVGASDDYGIARATLHLTLARGSGENIKFSDREVPLPQSADPRRRSWQKAWSLAALGMEPGDELYFFVRATDNSPEHPHTAQSPTYTLRLPGPEAEALDSSALPSVVKPENLRSQRQIIIDTEQLIADMRGSRKLPAAEARDRSERIADDQAHLRRRYGAFLGEESTLFGEEAEHGHGAEEHDHEMKANTNMAAMFGHAHDVEDNATIFDPRTKALLKRAIAAMWDAEKGLRAIAPRDALPPEYKALGAIKELQQAERLYLHRAAFEPPAIKEEKRMSGDMAGAQSTKRAQQKASDGIPADVRALVQALSGGRPLPALWARTARDAVAQIANEEQRLAAQRSVQDVADGCTACRGPLAAWLRSTLTQAPVVLQAKPEADTPFGRAWRGGEAR